MSRIYSVGYQRIRFLRWSDRSSQGEQLVFPDRGDALAFLRRLAQDRECRVELRRLFAEEKGSQCILGIGDASVLEQLATRLAAGAIRVEVVPRQPVQLMLSSAETGKVGKSAPLPRDTVSSPAPVYPFTLCLLDQAGMGIAGIDIDFAVDSESTPRAAVRTDKSGMAKIADGQGMWATATIKDIKQIEDVIASRKKLPRKKLPEPLPADKQVENLRVDLPGVALTTGKTKTLIITRSVYRARLRGGYFDTDKTFLAEAAVHALRDAMVNHQRPEVTKMLVVGHTDTVGKENYNLGLSLERAKVVKEYLTHAVDLWVDRFTKTKTKAGRVWGDSEVQHMLNSLPGDKGNKPDPGRPANTATLKKLVQAYMNLCGNPLAPKIEILAHGCGESFPLLDKRDEQEKPEHRRLELLFFHGPIAPVPRGETSPKGTPEYGAWEEQIVESRDSAPILEKIVSITILVHGVWTNAAWFKLVEQEVTNFLQDKIEVPLGSGNIKHKLKYLIIPFKWGSYVTRTQGGQPHYAVDEVHQMFENDLNTLDRIYQGHAAVRLKELIDECSKLGVQINVIAHSNGTLETCGALLLGCSIDNFIMMGSPLDCDNNRSQNELNAAVKKVKKDTINFWSWWDEWATQKGGIGGYGNDKDYLAKNGNIKNVEFAKDLTIQTVVIEQKIGHSDYMIERHMPIFSSYIQEFGNASSKRAPYDKAVVDALVNMGDWEQVSYYNNRENITLDSPEMKAYEEQIKALPK